MARPETIFTEATFLPLALRGYALLADGERRALAGELT